MLPPNTACLRLSLSPARESPLMPRLKPALLPLALLCFATAAMAQNPTGPDVSELIGRIAQADTNGDGQITRAELIAYRAGQFSRLDRNGDGFIDTNDVPGMVASRFEPRIRQMNAQFDANHDGRVSRDEFVNGPTLGFDMADANHDGVVTQAELRAAMGNASATRGQ